MLYSLKVGQRRVFEKNRVLKKDSGVITEALCLKPVSLAMASRFSEDTNLVT